ncbi:acyltransferase [uncultured Cloacibacillus sp.]|uniref:acyltransferase n=1 Tax=uncultured Cloacibacillus sp. TaxID=889794 RepID=UPI002616D75E|nr:acyltransferase [uncultured Cloacibacillus sp.]
MKQLIKKIYSKLNTYLSLKNIPHGANCKCNFPCKFSKNTIIGTNCHFNGISISGVGKVVIGDNFHSGKNIRILTTFHNFDKGNALPYDNTTYDKDVIIGNNVWLGEAVIILGGVEIGEGAVIQAGSVVCIDVPPMSIAGGHPAVPFKYRDENHYLKLKKEEKFM